MRLAIANQRTHMVVQDRVLLEQQATVQRRLSVIDGATT
jgi:hypothetical protein